MTDDYSAPRWPAWAVLGEAAAVAGLMALSLGLYPANLHDPAARDGRDRRVGDILTAATAHLAINLILGLVGGGVGTLISRSRRIDQAADSGMA